MTLKEATIKQRIFTWFIDFIMYGLLCFISGFVLATIGFPNKSNEIAISLYVGYYVFCEKIWGQTLGKYIMKTCVLHVNQRRSANVIEILLRSIFRLLPIDFIPILLKKKPLHDTLSFTIVITINPKSYI